jgi:hypothetical protein
MDMVHITTPIIHHTIKMSNKRQPPLCVSKQFFAKLDLVMLLLQGLNAVQNAA